MANENEPASPVAVEGPKKYHGNVAETLKSLRSISHKAKAEGRTTNSIIIDEAMAALEYTKPLGRQSAAQPQPAGIESVPSEEDVAWANRLSNGSRRERERLLACAAENNRGEGKEGTPSEQWLQAEEEAILASQLLSLRASLTEPLDGQPKPTIQDWWGAYPGEDSRDEPLDGAGQQGEPNAA